MLEKKSINKTDIDKDITLMNPLYGENFGEPCREVRKRFIERVKKLRAKSSQVNQ